MERLKSQKLEPPPEVVGEYWCLLPLERRLTAARNLDFQSSLSVSVDGNALPEVRVVDNQPAMIQEDQLQGHHAAPHNSQDTPQEHLQQQNQILAQQGLPQSHQDLPAPGNQEAAQGLHHLQ